MRRCGSELTLILHRRHGRHSPTGSHHPIALKIRGVDSGSSAWLNWKHEPSKACEVSCRARGGRSAGILYAGSVRPGDLGPPLPPEVGSTRPLRELYPMTCGTCKRVHAPCSRFPEFCSPDRLCLLPPISPFLPAPCTTHPPPMEPILGLSAHPDSRLHGDTPTAPAPAFRPGRRPL